MKKNIKQKDWYEQPRYIITSLVLLFPLGLYLMWKYTKWDYRLKIGYTLFIAPMQALLAAAIIILAILMTGHSNPSLGVDHLSTGDRIETEQSSYTLTGKVYDADNKTSLTINDTNVSLSDTQFSYTIELHEGENPVRLHIKREEYTSDKTVVVYRLTEAEVQARKTEEAQKLAEETKQNAIAAEKADQDKLKQIATDAATKGDGLAEAIREVRVIKELDGTYSVNVTFLDDNYKYSIIKQTMGSVYYQLYKSGIPLETVTVAAKNSYSNKYGESAEIIVFQTQITKDVADKINLNADQAVLEMNIIPGLWTVQKVHSDIKKQM